MEIKFLRGQVRFDRSDCIVFKAEANGQPVTCIITDEAIRGAFGATRDAMELAFEQHRPRIEAAARRLIAAGHATHGEFIITAKVLRHP
jgi:hypothetical protein